MLILLLEPRYVDNIFFLPNNSLIKRAMFILNQNDILKTRTTLRTIMPLKIVQIAKNQFVNHELYLCDFKKVFISLLLIG